MTENTIKIKFFLKLYIKKQKNRIKAKFGLTINKNKEGNTRFLKVDKLIQFEKNHSNPTTLNNSLDNIEK